MARAKKVKSKKIVVNRQIDLGDMIEEVTKATGIKKLVEVFTDGKDCGCDKRKEKLNKIKAGRNIKVNCFTKYEYNTYDLFVKTRTIKILEDKTGTGTLQNEQIVFLSNLYGRITNQPAYNCRSCSSKPFIKMIDVLDQVYEVYKNELNK